MRRKECEPWTDDAFKSPAWFCPHCSMLFCDIQKYTTGDDATPVVVLFCRQSHLGCTDMSLQQKRDKMPKFSMQQKRNKMPKFASLSDYTYQINNTLNACVKFPFCSVLNLSHKSSLQDLSCTPRACYSYQLMSPRLNDNLFYHNSRLYIL